MPIVSSTSTTDAVPQADGTYYVVDSADDGTRTWRRIYAAPDGHDVASARAAWVVSLDEMLAEAEANEVIG